MQVDGTLAAVMGRRMVLGEIVGMILTARLPIDLEVALADTVSHPIKAHVDGFGAALLDLVIDDPFCRGIVRFDGCWWLWVAHFFQCGAEHGTSLGIEK